MNKVMNKQLVFQSVFPDWQRDTFVRFIVTTLFISILFSLTATADTLRDKTLSMRDQAALEEKILEKRLNDLIPELMLSNNIDAWVLIAREYNEDPVVKTMLPGTWISARRRTVLIFLDHGAEKGVERLAVARYQAAHLFKASWDQEKQPDQMKRAAEILAEFDAKKIALNYSDVFGLADGITFSEYHALRNALPEKLKNRIVSGSDLAIAWLETRIPAEMEIYPGIIEIAHGIIAEGYTSNVVKPGKTSSQDLVWWYRQRIRDLGLITWFHPSVSIQRMDGKSGPSSLATNREADKIIQYGDLLHVDFGIKYLRLNTDTQQHAYVLKPGETDAPAGLKAALKKGNQLQDILTSNFAVGRTGNEILKATREQAISAGLKPSIYTHPIGYHGHAAGTNIGLWDHQEGVPGMGDVAMHANTAYSIELNVRVSVPEWDNKEIRIALEEDGFFDGKKHTYIGGRQTTFHLIDH